MVRPVKPSLAAGGLSTSAILMFYRADFPSEPRQWPEFRLEGPSIQRHQPPRTSRDAENP
jgi:hypothetical protein